MKIAYISSQTGDATYFRKPVSEVCDETGESCSVYCFNGSDASDPLKFQEMTTTAFESDLVLFRCMADPSRMKRFGDLVKVMERSDALFMVYSGNPDICFSYRGCFKGTDEEYSMLHSYMSSPCLENDKNIIRWLLCKFNGTGVPPDPVVTESSGVFIDRRSENGCNVGIMFPSSLIRNENTAHIESLADAFEKKGVGCVCVHFSSVCRTEGENFEDVVSKHILSHGGVDALVIATPFPQSSGQDGFFERLGIPVFQALSVNGAFVPYGCDGWDNVQSNAMGAIWPEMDGQIITVPIASVTEGRMYSPVDDRIERLVESVVGWISLAKKPAKDKRVAILLYQPSESSGRIGAAAGLDAFESLRNILEKLETEGYEVGHVPDSHALADRIMQSLTNNLDDCSSDKIRYEAVDFIDVSDYSSYFNGLSEYNKKDMEAYWGKPPGEVMVENDRIVVPGLMLGNVYIGYQPPRAWGDGTDTLYHDSRLPPTHQYMAFYRWLKHGFGADAVIHLGTHGTLEWLPGKGFGLTSNCYPDIALDSIPNIYPYIIDDPGEGIQAKRRSEAVLIGHMCPVMRKAGIYEGLDSLDESVQEYLRFGKTSEEKGKDIISRIQEGVESLNLGKDLGFPSDADSEYISENVERIHDYITEIRDASVRDGLHVLGEAPEGEMLDNLIHAIVSSRNGDVQSIRKAALEAMGRDDDILRNPSGFTDGMMNSDISFDADRRITELLERMRASDYDLDASISIAKSMFDDTTPLVPVLEHICRTVVPGIRSMDLEIINLSKACAGGFVPPGPSGAPTRGNAGVLPTGRNYYGIDPGIVPTRSSWETGKRMAEAMVSRFVKTEGRFPDHVAIVLWATDTMKTGGDDIAYILYLMGVAPVWSPDGGRVLGTEIIPLKELGRPRMDVTMRITGLFRDTFPGLISLLDDAVRSIGALDEKDEDNILASNLRKEIAESIASGIPYAEAERNASARIFGAAPGSYGCGVNHAIEGGGWKDVGDLAKIYLQWGCHAYGEGLDGRPLAERFERRLSSLDVAVKNMPDRETDIMDIDDVYSYLGGMEAVVRSRGGHMTSYIGDSSDPDNPKIKETDKELKFVFRSKILNPVFVEGLKRHGYSGAAEIPKITEYAFGWGATSASTEDWMFDGMYHRFLEDEDTFEWMKEKNPYAAMETIERLMEAYERGVWNADEDILDEMRRLFGELESRIESMDDNDQ